MSVRDGIDKAIEIMQEQLSLHAHESKHEKLKLNDVKSITDIAKTLVMIDKNTKEHPDDPSNIDNMTDEEIRAEAERIMGKYQK